MSDDSDDFDPDADVPIWINVVVPVATVLVFVAVIVLLWRTDKEMPLDSLKHLISKASLLNKFSPHDVADQDISASKEALLGSEGRFIESKQTKDERIQWTNAYGSLASGY